MGRRIAIYLNNIQKKVYYFLRKDTIWGSIILVEKERKK
jgi:hypothetical protein